MEGTTVEEDGGGGRLLDRRTTVKLGLMRFAEVLRVAVRGESRMASRFLT